MYLQLAFQFLETIWKKPLHLLRSKFLIGINKIIIWFQHFLFPRCFFQNYLTNYPFKDLAQTQSQFLCWNNFSPLKKYTGRSCLVFILLYFICIGFFFLWVNHKTPVESNPVLCIYQIESRVPITAGRTGFVGYVTCASHMASRSEVPCVWFKALLSPSENS